MKFEKVSVEQYIKAIEDEFYTKMLVDLSGVDRDGITKEWEDIKTPIRATKNSAGYDFFAPFGFKLKAGQTIKIPTGIKCKLDEDKFLAILPRSSLGFKYRLQLDNTLGVVDADFYNNPNNEGLIFIKITNDSKENKELSIQKGEAFAQGIILNFYKCEEDAVTTERKGGMGSTNG